MNKEMALFIQWIFDNHIKYEFNVEAYISGSKYWKFDSIEEIYTYYKRHTKYQ